MTGPNKLVVIGLGGVTCSGKTSLAKLIIDYYTNLSKSHANEVKDVGSTNATYCVEKIFMDDYFLPENDPRHVIVKELNHINWELKTSLDIYKMTTDVLHIIDRLKSSTSQFAICLIEGFLVMNCEPIKSLCNLKFFVDLDYESCISRRSKRIYDPPDVPGYFEKVVWPESQMNKESAILSTPDLHILNGSQPLDINFNKLKDIIDKYLLSMD